MRLTRNVMDATSRAATAVTCALCVACGDGGELREPEPMPDAPAIDYPVALWDQGVQGETEVMVHVDAYGEVDSVLVSKSSGHAEFDSAAVRGARRLRFTPGLRGERPVAMWTKLPVRFSRDSTAVLGESTGAGVTNDGTGS